jgi:hypothetical protein
LQAGAGRDEWLGPRATDVADSGEDGNAVAIRAVGQRQCA